MIAVWSVVHYKAENGLSKHSVQIMHLRVSRLFLQLSQYNRRGGLSCYTVIALGTMSGGWKIIKTMGSRITKVTPFEGVAAETAGALTLFVTEMLKIPVSTTHTITGSIIGAGATKRLSAVRWGVTINLLWAWILTIPVSALIAAGVYKLSLLFL